MQASTKIKKNFATEIWYVANRDAPIIGSAIGNTLYWLIFSYQNLGNFYGATVTLN